MNGLYLVVFSLIFCGLAWAQTDTTRPAIALNAADGSPTFTSLPMPLRGTVYDAGGMGQLLSARLMRAPDGVLEFWNGSAWTTTDKYWMAQVAPASEPGNYNWSISVPWPTGENLPRGSYTIHVSAYDNAWNGAGINRTLTVAAPDTQGPQVSIETPTQGEIIDSATNPLSGISGQANDGEGTGVAYVRVQLSRIWGGVASSEIESWDGTAWTYRGNNYYFTAALGAPDATGQLAWNSTMPLPPQSQLTTGRYFVTVLAYDKSGNRTVVQHNLHIGPYDGTAPTVSVTFPAEGQQLYSLPSIRGASDDEGSGVSDLRVWLRRFLSDGSSQNWGGNDGWHAGFNYFSDILPSRYDFGWTRDQNLPVGAQLPPGDYQISAHALDRYNNVGVAVRNFRIVAVPPLSIDAHLRGTTAAPWLGEGFSNADASGQTLGGTIQSGQTQTRQIRMVRYGGVGSKTVRVTIPDWADFAQSGWTASFSDEASGADISAQITSAGGWSLTMNEGEARQFAVEVSAPDSVTAGQTRALTFRVEADPTSETSALDVVKATWRVTAPTPDLAIRADNGAADAGDWLGALVRNETGADQTIERVAHSSHVVRGQIKLSVADASDGEIIKWSVPGWDAFRANGWSAKFFDAVNNNREITDQITGEGWTSTHTDGIEPIIRWEVTAPADASDVTRTLSVRAQVPGGAADVVNASVRVLPNVRPDVSVRRTRGNKQFVGRGVYSPTPQRLELVVAIQKTESFAITVKNPGNATAQFLFERPTLPTGWSYKLYDTPGKENLLDLDDPQSLITAPLAPGQSIEWLLELDTNAYEPEVDVPIRFRGANTFDECLLALQLQGIKGAKYSLDGGANWKTVEETVITVPKGSTLGFEAIPLNPGVPWPDDPFEPLWEHKRGRDKDDIYYGALVYLYHPIATPTGQEGETARVACGNEFTVKVKVKDEEAGETP